MVSFMVSMKEATMARVNILKRIKVDNIEWYERGKRRRASAGLIPVDVLDAARRKKHELEGQALGIAEPIEQEKPKPIVLHIAVKRYLEIVEALKKPNTFRKYRAVLDRFCEF